MKAAKYQKQDVEKVMSHNCFKDAGYYGGTFKEFIVDCLKEFWAEGEGFSGKRPICDSGWEDIAGAALSILEPKICKIDDEGHHEVVNRKLYNKTFNWLVDYIFYNKS